MGLSTYRIKIVLTFWRTSLVFLPLFVMIHLLVDGESWPLHIFGSYLTTLKTSDVDVCNRVCTNAPSKPVEQIFTILEPILVYASLTWTMKPCSRSLWDWTNLMFSSTVGSGRALWSSHRTIKNYTITYPSCGNSTQLWLANAISPSHNFLYIFFQLNHQKQPLRVLRCHIF